MTQASVILPNKMRLRQSIHFSPASPVPVYFPAPAFGLLIIATAVFLFGLLVMIHLCSPWQYQIVY